MKRTRRNNLRKRLSRTFMRRFTSCVAMLVVFTTTYMLILPAVAIDQNTAEETPGVYLPPVLQYACAWQTHSHTDGCYIEKDILDAQGLPTGQKEKILVCGREDWTVHEHSDSCYQDGVLVCTLPEHPRHEHDEDCYETRRELICTQEEHVHTDTCYEEVQTGTERTLVCGYTEGEVISPEVWSDPVYSEPVYNEAGELLEDSVLLEEAVLLQEEEVHHHTEDCYAETPVYAQQLTCGQAEHVHTDACWQEEKVLTCTKQELHTHTEACYEKGPEGESPIEMGWAWYVEENGQQILLGDPAHRICGKTELLEHVHSDACFREISENTAAEENAGVEDTAKAEDNTEDAENTESKDNADDGDSAETMPAQTFREATETMQVSVTAEEGTFPAGTTMKVKDVEDEEVISSICDAATGDENSIVKVRATDITFYTAEGEPIEPIKPVRVVMTPVAKEEEDLNNTSVEVVHVKADGEAAVVEQKPTDAETEESGNAIEVAFDADAFSVYALVYTVDFHWEVDGKMYKFSIPGGGFVSLLHLVEALGIANVEESAEASVDQDSESAEDVRDGVTLNQISLSEATKKFVTAVDSVEFSNPELVWIGMAEAETTVGELKEANKLDVQYSAELTEDEIRDINAQTVGAGDWAFISLLPFETEEMLTVTMKDGEQFTIQVTDAQLKQTVISASGETYEITVTYDDQAEIPKGAELSVREILPDEEGYGEYYQNAMRTIGIVKNDHVQEKGEEVQETAVNVSTETIAEDRNNAASAEAQTEDVAAEGEEGTEDQTNILGDDSEYARFFDITIWNGQEKIEPKSEVKVDIRLLDAPEETRVTPKVVHFAEEGPEQLDLLGEDDGMSEIQFMTNEFSVYSVVYTVDFHWEVDGKEYSFSIPGGGFVSFEALMEVLHVAGIDQEDRAADSENEELASDKLTLNEISISEETEKLVADVTQVEFSSPDLVWVHKIDSESTVGALKEENDLACQYSAELTKEDIEKINAQTVRAGDWALISLLPFASEETLKVTMKTGETFVIKVTDAMDNTAPYAQGTSFTAYNTRPDGFTINLFDYGPESDLDNGNNNLKDKGSQYNSGINYNHTLKFTAYGKKPSEVQTNGQNVLTMNHFSGTDAATQGIVDKNLSGGYPKLDGGESLAYLFNTSADGNNKKVYKDVSGLFQKDADGKYYYDSNVNYAYYNPNQGNGGDFVLCDTFPEEGSDWGVGFFPFNPWTGEHTCIHWNGWCPPRNGSNQNAGWAAQGGDGKYHSEYYYNHHFGMTLEGTFQLTPDGKLNDKDLVFNFSGDDDLWVYIDDVLVLDIGGIHNPVGGSINFRTGVVHVDSAYQVNSVINDSQHGPEANTTIAQAFTAAGKTWNNEPYAEHTIKVFYMERGGCYSNCRMEFNLTRFKDVEFDKKDQYGDPVENAEFRLFKEDGTPLIETYIDHDDNDTVKYRDYVRNSDEDGHIKFDHVPVGTYYIRETDVPEGYIKDEAVYTAKIIVERNDDGTYSVHSYVLRNGAQTDRVRNIKQADITLALDKKWKLGETEVNPTSASASFQLMRVKIVEEQTTVPGTKTPAVVKLQDKSGTSLCSSINVNVGDTIRISEYLLNVDNYPWNATDTIVTASGEEIGSLHSWNNYGNKQSEGPIDYTIKESDVVNGEVVLKTKEKNSSDFTTKPELSRYSEGPEPAPVTVIVETPVTEAIETFSLPEDSSWAKSFTKPVYDEHGRKYTYYFVETSNSEGTAPVYVDGNGQVITDPAGLATSENLTQTIINNIEYGSIEITKNLLKNGNESSLTGTFYYAVYAAADVEDGVPKTGAQAAITGSITVSENDNGTNSDTIRVPIGTYYVYELTGEGGQPILEPSRQRIGERTYQVTGSGTSTEVGLTDGSAEFTNNYETVDKTATKSWSDNTEHPTIYFKLFYISRGHDEEHGSIIEFVEVDGAEIKELPSGTTAVTWEDLPKYDANGEEYTYIVKEYIKVNGEYVAAAPDGYVKSENGLSVNNTKSEGYNPKTTYVGTKTWEDTANNGATRPDALHVDLYANGVKLENCTAQWTKGTGDDSNVWTYTFSDLPVFDENGVYISYYAVETPVSGYDQGPTTTQQTIYQVISSSVDDNVGQGRITTCTNLDIPLVAETDLAYVVIKKSAKRHLIWTQRPITRDEKNKIYEDINKVSGFINELSDSTVEFISGLPVETEFFKGTVTASKKSDKVMHVEFANHETWAQLCYGSYKYTYDPGRTDFVNSLITTEVNAMKAWIDSTGEPMTPAEGTTVTFDLYADDVNLNKPVILNGKVDVIVLSDEPEEAETQEENADAIAANAYEKEAWKAYWGNLPTHNAAGEAITYTVKETAVPGFENMNPDGVSSDETITNKQIVTEIHILKKKADGQPLTGAKFRLDQYDADRREVIKTWGPLEVSSEQGKEGTLTFEGLGVGKYTLVETEVPDGYVKISDDPEFEIVPDEDGILKVQFTDTDEVTYDDDSSTFHVTNIPGAALPSTGGPGTRIFSIFGSIMILGAGVLLWRRRRTI